ncbi:MAG TPA: SRPBCC family protein [Candidatus Dormibacteraeota bacterium]|nr:SRPBCC family protein [Candidatus Dormibacteraeota bacterium]
MKTIKQSVIFDCPAHAVYAAFMSEKKHAEFTHAPASIEPKVGGKYTAYEDGLVGEFIKLVPDELIGMKWRCVMDGWPEDHYSTITIELNQTSDGTELELTQTDVPDACEESIAAGWHEFYWEPMQELLDRD